MFDKVKTITKKRLCRDHDNRTADDIKSARTLYQDLSNMRSAILDNEVKIESLEQALSMTRSMLETSESLLRIKETCCSAEEDMNNQLRSQVNSLLDKNKRGTRYARHLETQLYDSNKRNEEYLTRIFYLESKLELAKIQEEGLEEYISALEQQLIETAEAHHLIMHESNQLRYSWFRPRGIRHHSYQSYFDSEIGTGGILGPDEKRDEDQGRYRGSIIERCDDYMQIDNRSVAAEGPAYAKLANIPLFLFPTDSNALVACRNNKKQNNEYSELMGMNKLNVLQRELLEARRELIETLAQLASFDLEHTDSRDDQRCTTYESESE